SSASAAVMRALMLPALNIGAVTPNPSAYTLSATLGNPRTDSAPTPPFADRTHFGYKSARAAPRLAAAALTSVCASRRSGLCSSKLQGRSLGILGRVAVSGME